MSTIGPIRRDTVEHFHVPPYLGVNPRSLYRRQSVYQSQPRDFTKPLPYYSELSRAAMLHLGEPYYMHYKGADAPSGPAAAYCRSHFARLSAVGRQDAYGKLVGKLKSESMGWGENLATRKQAYSMMLHRIGTLTNAARRLKRGDIPGFCRALGVPEKRSRSKAKNLSSTWLEYHFGWEPLYGDIHTACKVLSADPPSSTVKGVARHLLFETKRTTAPVAGEWLQHYRVWLVAKMQGDYHVENPNKYLLNTCGVINPVGLAWELVPFSFAVDWFIPVGQYLQSYTDFWGLARSNEFTSVCLQVDCECLPGASYYGELPDHMQFHSVWTQRTQGIDLPLPTLKLFKGFSLTRGATAVALLVGMLRSLG